MLQCIDLYAGAGGLSLGLLDAGVDVRVAVDLDLDCETTYTTNISGPCFIQSCVHDITVKSIKKHLNRERPLLLAGGPPCQLFSRLNKNPSQQSEGVRSYIRLVRDLDPAYVVFENVPAIMRRQKAWNFVLRSLRNYGYDVTFGVLKATAFGVPQQRERLIVVAGRQHVGLPVGSFGCPRTVRDAIGHLPETSMTIPNHNTMKLSPENLKRIKNLRDGENSRVHGQSFADSYARMSWDKPAPTITTKCISFSNGRFGHPRYDRGLTIREAAILQGFPASYKFSGSLWSCARQVGNAVPPPVAFALGKHILDIERKRRQRPTRRRRVG